MKFIFTGILAGVILASSAIAGAPQGSEVSISAPAAELLEQRGFDHFYNLEYDHAVAVFEELRGMEPDNPGVYNDLASAYLYRKLQSAGALHGDLFAGSNRFFRTKKIPQDEEFERTFKDVNQTAISLCEKRLKQNQNDQMALYDCGVAYADRAAYMGLVERAKVETISSGRKASEYHTKLAKLYPQCYDAYLIPGLFQYIVGSLPGSMKFLLYVAGVSGDKDKGIASVERAATTVTAPKRTPRFCSR